MELSWNEQRVAEKAEVIALARPKSDDLWALGHARSLFSTRTALLHGHAGAWDWSFAVDRPLDSIGTLADGSVLAVGESISVLFDGDRWSTIRSGLMGCRRIWGVHPTCANALTSLGLFYFDGQNWEEVDLEAKGISGYWVDGDCDSSGAGWIVGTYETHSCMAAGSGTNWKRDGCGSWYLYLVYVGEGGHAFAVGGDGVWRHEDTGWIGIDDKRDVSRFPLAVSAVGSTPIVVATTPRDFQRRTSELDVLTAAGWQTIRAPITLDVEHRMPLEVDIEARLLIAQGAAVWVSSRLMGS